MAEDLNVRLARMEERQISQCEAIDSLTERLFGNGQPGLIAGLSKRIRRLEWYLALAVGAGTAIVWIIARIW